MEIQKWIRGLGYPEDRKSLIDLKKIWMVVLPTSNTNEDNERIILMELYKF